jgi:twitching motility two-component system response regulator PilG
VTKKHVKLAQGAGQRATGGATARERPPSALVLDDSLVARERMKLELQTLGVTPDLAETAWEANRLLAERTYDIIFLDIVLPDGNGFKLCREFKRNPRHRHTPVCLVTGKTSPFDRLKGEMAGCDLYLTKPLERCTLRKAVEKCLASLLHDTPTG